MPAHYPFKEIEARWQARWNAEELYRAPDVPRDKYYVLVMFAYPSGDIHMGHFRNYIVGDAVARKKMMEGKDVLHPFGWDAFGLPAENAAIKRGIHPDAWTRQNIAVSRATLQKVGIGYDWDREVITCVPEYYRWNQWLFLRLFERDLAYRKNALVNWCPGCQTVLANEQVTGGVCERCDSPVEKKNLAQWFFRITAYAERLLADLDKLPGWPENVKTMQRNWIGRSEGLEVDFPLEHSGAALRIFTTRPDTIYGVTYMAVAPESPCLEDLELEGEYRAAVDEYVRAAGRKSDLERTAEGEKDGVFTGRYAVNPFSGERVPIWVADYVLATYGTGAVMAVPAHDERDFAFARRYDLPVRVVLKVPGAAAPPEPLEAAFTDHDAEMIHSSIFDGRRGPEAIEATIRYAEEKGIGQRQIHYRLRDWLVSRQRYWGTPIPIVHCPACGLVPVPESELPVRLPEGEIDFIPRGRSPLADVESFVNVACPRCGGAAKRDVDTMDTFIDSSWYFLRYLDPHNDREPFGIEAGRRWLPVDKYIGGITHATGHLLYFRFITKLLYDMSLVPVDEPSRELFNHGMVMDSQGRVMSKSLGNVTSPIEFMDEQGIDVARLTMFFASPADKELLWSDAGAVGAARFLDRVWRMAEAASGTAAPPDLGRRYTDSELGADEFARYRRLNQTIRKVTQDLEGMQFNTAIAALMELLNELGAGAEPRPLDSLLVARMAQLLAPLAPHFAEEVWARLGFTTSIFKSNWPEPDPEALEEVTVTIAVQVNGKLRGQVQAAPELSEAAVLDMAMADERISRFAPRERIKKTIFVKGRLLNLVVQP